MSIRRPVFLGLSALALLTALGCEEKKTAPKPEGSGPDGGGAPRSAGGVDKSIAEAVAAVAGGAGPAAGEQKGPPDTGVFAPGAGDKEMRAGEPPKLVLGGKGSGETITFVTAVPKPGKKLDGKVQVLVQTGPRSAMPTTELSFSLDAAEKAADPAAPAGPLLVDGKVTAAKLAAEQPGELPPGTDKIIGKAKGSHVRFELQPTGAGRVTGVELSKDLDEALGQLVRSASDALALAYLPYPTEPVGVGAFWMVTSRESFAGLDVVVYRMLKLQKIEAGKATIDVSAKRYTAGGALAFGLPPHTLVEFSGNSTGQIQVSAADTTSVRGDISDVLLANLVPKDMPQGAPPGQKMAVHVEVRTRLAVGH
jgi:hypothetical protein